jgi:deoxyadenosine/deoxycytidine kinase
VSSLCFRAPLHRLYTSIYIKIQSACCKKYIKKRGRSYEQDISAEYLNKINSGYLEYIKSQTDLNVLIIDVSDRDFIKIRKIILHST